MYVSDSAHDIRSPGVTGAISDHQHLNSEPPRSIDPEPATTSHTAAVSISPEVSAADEPVSTRQTTGKQTSRKADDTNEFNCRVCCKLFSSRRSWKRHQLTYHVASETWQRLQGTVPCPLCKKMFTSDTAPTPAGAATSPRRRGT